MNALLATIGESPVETLLSVLPTDAGTALANIRRFSRQLQKSGWSFNLDKNFSLAPDIGGEIILPLNTLKVDASNPNEHFVQRGKRLYDPLNHTFIFDKPVVVDIVFGLAFDELPETARNFIMTAAARRFQDQFLGDGNLHAFNERDERTAWAEFLADEAENEDHNVLHSPTPARILRYRKRT
ncbi:hypothetical protein [Castellaniella sp.]|uniref:hypothetical protein n=1 Tax=Castellaniella sp. TaxID=1955812 RepID=UPI002AFE4F1D|nr:hypothetical protein [Castellaniella sp.]